MEDNSTEIKWVSGVKNGSRLYFNQLFLKYNKKIYGLARKLHLSHEDAEEIVQEVFLTIWRNREHIDPTLSFNAYIFTISQRFIFKYFRKKAYQTAYQTYALVNLNTRDQILSDWEMEDLDNLINQYINLMPEQRKKVFIMSRQENLTHQEISSALDISIRTVENHIYKALKFLKERLSKEEILILLLFFWYYGQ